MKRKIYLTGCLFFLCLMLLMPQLTLAGTKQGLTLWFQNLLPALLPYTILSSLILGLDPDSRMTSRFDPVSTKLLGISGNGCFALFTGLLCGYPLGARITAQMIRTDKISLAEGQYLISFCNVASPGFLIQYVVAQSLGDQRCLKPILLCVYGASLLTALILHPVYRRAKRNFSSPKRETDQNLRQPSFYTLGNAIMDSFEAMTRLGGYLIVFSIIAKMVTALFSTVTTSYYLLIGVTEITNGVHEIATGSGGLFTKLMLLSFCVSFGGLSCFVQSAGMCKDSGLSMPLYFASKLLNGCLALLIMYIQCGYMGFV